MNLDRTTTFELTEISPAELRLLANGIDLLYRTTRQSDYLKDVSDEQLAAATGDGPAGEG